MMCLGGFVFGKVLPGTCPVAGENPPSNQINNDFAAKALQYPKNIVSLRLRLEDRLHLGTKGRCSRSEVKQIKINRDLFCISLDLHYLCTQNI
jgi:hypothetical protein